MENSHKQIFNGKKELIYIGNTYKNKPCGAGTSFYPDGTIYQEGIFGIKGILMGREYYPDGKLRFAGVYGLNHGYGPNYPEYGVFKDREGKEVFSGFFEMTFSQIGFPRVRSPADYGSILQEEAPVIHYLMWDDLK